MLYPRHEKRAEKVREKLREQGIDVLILTHLQKMLYVNGVYHNDWNVGTCIFLWANDPPTLLASNSEKGRLMFESYLIKDIQFWYLPFYGLEPIDFEEKCVQIIQEHDLQKGTIAVEEPSIPWWLYSKLREEFPQATFTDGEDLINEVMREKDDEELSLIQRASAMTDAGLDAVINIARVGITETQLAGVAEQPMRELGCSWFYSPTQMNFDNRVICDHIPTDRILQRGDKIGMDLHPVWKEYRGDYFRTLSFGNPSREYEKMAETCTKLAHEWVKSMVPGASTKEISIAFREGVKSAGYPDPAPKDLGHGIGTGHLPPLVCAGREWKLKENEPISICPYIYDPGNYAFVMEFLVQVRQGGGVPLNKHPLGLIIIDR